MKTYIYSLYTIVLFSLLSFSSFAQQTYKPDAILTAPISAEGIANFMATQTNGSARMAGPGEIESPVFGGISGPDSVCSYGDPVTYSVAVTTDAQGNPLQFHWFLPSDWTIVSGQGTHSIEVIPGMMSGQVAVFAVGYCICSYACKPVISEDCDMIDPLPVKLISFEASQAASAIQLKWTTAQEKNNDRFEIERSLDGKSFTRIGSVRGSGNTDMRRDYSFEDRSANKVAYYRLKQVDFDGRFEYSPVRAVQSAKSVAVSVYPNPATSFITLASADEMDANTEVRITSVTGQLVYTGSARELSASQNKINISHLNAGVYIATISSGGSTQSVRIVKN